MKIRVPWLAGHAAAFALASGGGQSRAVPTPVWIITAAAYALPVAHIASLFIDDGRTPSDRITGTQVIGRS